MLGLYIHIPFCQNICHYCDFPKRIKKNDDMVDKYLNRLEEEMAKYQLYFNDVRTIYIGGGTPTSLNYNQLLRLLTLTKPFKNIVEFTIEANPENLTIDKCLLFADFGVDRVSLGVQSFNKQNLDILGRKHQKEDVIKAVCNLKLVNITNINIDLMFALPNQTLEMVNKDLEEFYKLDIPHISYYSLILEEKTLFYYWYRTNKLSLISNDLEGEMYEFIIDNLEKHGYKQYEISNFSKNKESLHNQIYWKNQEYIGLGAGASGYFMNQRYYNNHLICEYQKEFINHVDILTKEDKLNEELMLGLRLRKGVNIKEVNEKYHINLFKTFPILKKYIQLGFLECNERLSLTKKGLMHGNDIFEIFVKGE